ncbi:MAG: hypothetical protein C4536_03385 [Actinobacteria bacterium]|jgi:hypothetical protein|nr:MAG: hypothetical protein C4536_03385 [Actinomycetota bacterium]
MKATVVILTVLLCGTALFVAGCPRAERLAGSEEAGTSGETGESSAQGSGAFTEVPGEISIYPGASQVGSGRDITVSGLRIEGTIDGATYHVEADYDDVAAWYREQLSGALEFAATVSGERGSGRGTIFVLLSGSGIGTAVTVATAEGGSGTTINIGSWQGSVQEGT